MTPRRHLSAAAVAAALLGAALPLAVVSAAEAKAPKRYVLCNKVINWVPVDYDGCLLSFSRAVRADVYSDFATFVQGDGQWAGTSPTAVSAMTCSRGGRAGLVAVNKVTGGLCVWNETWGHFGLGDHPDHTWECRVTSVVTASPTGRSRMRKGRMWTQWQIVGSPFQDVNLVGGDWPWCDKAVPEDTFTQD